MNEKGALAFADRFVLAVTREATFWILDSGVC